MTAVEAPVTTDPPGGEKPCAVKVEKTGWLSKRAHFTLWWRPTWFHLKGNQLFYGENEQNSVKTIHLVGALVEITADPLGWTITPKDQKRRYHLRAASVAEHESWMQGIIEAQMGCAQHGTHTCVVQ